MSAQKRKYGTWESENMERALSSYRNGVMGLNEAARTFSVPKATLKRRIDGTNNVAKEGNKNFGRCVDLPKEVEEDLVKHILFLEERFFGMSRDDLKNLAFQIAEANRIPHRFNQKKKQAGDKWYYSFLKRHPEISLRQPEATSIARARGFNKEKVMSFFDILEKIVDEYQFDATRIYNMDETGLSTVQKPKRVLAKKGKHQVGSITSGERGTNTTCICCVSAAGHYIPPMLIFKRLRFKEELARGGPPGALYTCSESGWINSEIFVEWLRHFISTVKPTPSNTVLLIMDGHYCHTKNLEAIQLAKNNGVVMISLPAHTTHRLQPLDVSFFKPLSVYFNEASDKWMRTNPMKSITQFQISELLAEAYGRAATIEISISGFRKAGIWPVNRNAFQDCDFVSSTLESEPLAGPSNMITAAEISPLPAKIPKKGKETTGTIVLTLSPYKKQLEMQQERKQNKMKRLELDQDKVSKKSWFCKICEQDKKEDMTQCMKCGDWLHDKCAKLKKTVDEFFCENCKS